MIKVGDRVNVSGEVYYGDDWYRVASEGTVEGINRKTMLINIDIIDGDFNVSVLVKKKYVSPVYPDYTCIEAVLKVENNIEEEIIQDAIDDELAEMSMAGANFMNYFDEVKYVGYVNEDGNYYINFLAPTHRFSTIKRNVVKFIENFIKDLSSSEYKDDWKETLNTEEIPKINGYEILKVREFIW